MELHIKPWKIEFREDNMGYIGKVILETNSIDYPYSTSKIATRIIINSIEYTIGIIIDNLDKCERVFTLHKP